MKTVLIALAIIALAAAPCAWDSGDTNNASWLAAIINAYVNHH